VYLMGQGPAGGMVRFCASCVVSRLTTWRGPPPYRVSTDPSRASRTGRRPARWMADTTAPTSAGAA